MKVAFIEDSVEMGGVQYSTFFLAERLMKEKTVDARIFLPDEGQFSILCQENNIPYCIYNGISYISTSFSLLSDKLRIPNPIAWVYNICTTLINCIKIKKRLKGQSLQLVVTKGLLTHFSAGLASKSLDLPVIWHLQDMISARYYGILISIFNQLANKIPDHIICDGQIIKNSIEGPVDERSYVLLNGIKTDELERRRESRVKIRKELGIPANAYVIGNLARITPWKGQEFLLGAFIKYLGKNPDAYLLLVGSPLFDNNKYFLNLKRLIKIKNLGKKVILPGYRTDLMEIFSAMDFFVYPSQEKDTSPLSLLSAISSGIPVAVSNIKSLNEITKLCPKVDVFDPNLNKMELVFLMEKYSYRKNRKYVGDNNRESAKNYFDISIHTTNMMKIFNHVLK